MRLKSILYAIIFIPVLAVAEMQPPYAVKDAETHENFVDIYTRMDEHKHTGTDGTRRFGVVGEITMFAGSSTTLATYYPGWLVCDGSSVSVTTYAKLYGTIGTTYGGTGVTTFCLPDFRGVFPKGFGANAILGANYAGATLGSTNADKFQGHRHDVNDTNGGDLAFEQVFTAGSNRYGIQTTAASTLKPQAQGMQTDGTNGTPRTGAITESQNIVVNFIIYTGL